MQSAHQVERWIERFPLVRGFSASHLQLARGTVGFPTLEAGAIAYELQDSCANYLMCIDGRTRVFRMSEGGREMLIYKVGSGGTCCWAPQKLSVGCGNLSAEKAISGSRRTHD
ncbi:hypothetical protein [Methylobacterium sp. WL19]|uniref:hypothetical protein n=1 Tax=Methylobacterium sp. WL19 TaxID=2603896 RepID=UPI001FEE6ADA|nr:hypothetical protein [Methylobacterium sp. WL19]